MYVNEFLVGADPEFVIVDDDSALRQFKENREFEIAAGKVGPDHGGYVAELRPTPARSTYTLVKRIQKLLNAPNWTDKERQYKWLAGPVQEVTTGGGVYPDCGCCCVNCCDCEEDGEGNTLVQPLGGHVHLDIRADNPTWDEIVDALDVQHRFLEDLEIFSQDDCAARRTEGYGQYKVVTCNHPTRDRVGKETIDRGDGDYPADEYHMEYRTPPSWLFHPRVAMLSLTGAKLAAADPKGTLESFVGKPVHLNTLTNWYDRYAGKDANAKRVAETLLTAKLKFKTSTDLKTTWKELDF